MYLQSDMVVDKDDKVADEVLLKGIIHNFFIFGQISYFE